MKSTETLLIHRMFVTPINDEIHCEALTSHGTVRMLLAFEPTQATWTKKNLVDLEEGWGYDSLLQILQASKFCTFDLFHV